MLPTLVKLGPFTIHSYGVMIAVSFLVVLYLCKRDAARDGLDPNVVADAAFWTLIVGLIGTRVLHIIMYPEYYSWSDPFGWVALWRGGLVFQGAFLPSFVFCYWFLRKKGIPFWRFVDLTCPYMALAQGIGRIGCFFNGCCYGVRSDAPWAIPFRRVPWDIAQKAEGSPAFLDHCEHFGLPMDSHWSYPVHPTQLYSAFALFALCFFLLYLRKRWRPFDGYLMGIYLILYGCKRLIVEFYRGDWNPVHWLGLSDQQCIAIGLSLLGVVMFVARYWWTKRMRLAPAAPLKEVGAGDPVSHSRRGHKKRKRK